MEPNCSLQGRTQYEADRLLSMGAQKRTLESSKEGDKEVAQQLNGGTSKASSAIWRKLLELLMCHKKERGARVREYEEGLCTHPQECTLYNRGVFANFAQVLCPSAALKQAADQLRGRQQLSCKHRYAHKHE